LFEIELLKKEINNLKINASVNNIGFIQFKTFDFLSDEFKLKAINSKKLKLWMAKNLSKFNQMLIQHFNQKINEVHQMLIQNNIVDLAGFNYYHNHGIDIKHVLKVYKDDSGKHFKNIDGEGLSNLEFLYVVKLFLFGVEKRIIFKR
jgi:beta-glucosidase/6-phospho-beta-glucosidase/beta-galactosidase